MVLFGDHVLTANKSGYIGVFNVSDPRIPILAGLLDTNRNGGLKTPHDIALFGDRIIVANADHYGPVHVQIYRVADLATHQLLPVDRWSIPLRIFDEATLLNAPVRTGCRLL